MTSGREIHSAARVVDCHNDFLLLFARERARGNRDSLGRRFLPQLRDGGVDVQVAPIYVDDELAGESALRSTLELIEHLQEEVDANPDAVALCRTGGDIDSAIEAGKIALVLALEGSAAVGADPTIFATLFTLGVRMASFTWMSNTQLAGGSRDGDPGVGLSRSGVEAFRTLERLGIVMDVSHLSVASTEEVLSLATRPLVASHSSARSVYDHHRNLHDEHIKEIAALGGVVGITAIPMFTDPSEATIDRVVDHIAHIAETAGIDHVGIGTDFIKEVFAEEFGDKEMIIDGEDWRATIPQFETPNDLPNLTSALERRGVASDDIHKILGGNFLRVFREVMGRTD